MSNSGDAAISAASGINNAMIEISGSKRQNKRAIDFWNMQNDYNHPRAQMQRLQEAGLNPNLVYGGGVSGASGRADSIGQPDKPDLSGVSKGLTNFLQQKAQKAQVDLLQQQVQTEKENTRLRMLQGNSESSRNFKQGIEDVTYGDLYKTTSEGQALRNEQMRIQTALSRQELETINNAGDAGTQKIIQDAARARHDANNAEKLGILRDLEIDLKNKNIDYYDTNQILDIIGKLLGLKDK